MKNEADNYNSLYPWQNIDYNNLIKIANNLPSVLLINSIKNIGVENLIQRFVAYLMCFNLDGINPCNKCNACLLLKNKSHPDYYILDSIETEDKKNKNITVDQIRDMLEFVGLSSHLGKYKIVFIQDTNLLNQNSANALLKILEEPPPHTLFILLSYDLNRILPTIKSRCYQYNIALPDSRVSLEYLQNKQTQAENQEFWLDFYDNAPLFEEVLSTLELDVTLLGLRKPSVENIYALSKLVDGDNFAFFMEIILKWLNDLTCVMMNSHVRYFKRQLNDLQVLSRRANMLKVFALNDKVISLMPWETHPLNHKLQIENILFKYQNVFTE